MTQGKDKGSESSGGGGDRKRWFDKYGHIRRRWRGRHGFAHWNPYNRYNHYGGSLVPWYSHDPYYKHRNYFDVYLNSYNPYYYQTHYYPNSSLTYHQAPYYLKTDYNPYYYN